MDHDEQMPLSGPRGLGPRWARPVGRLAWMAVLLAGLAATGLAVAVARDRSFDEVDRRAELVERDVREQLRALIETQVAAAGDAAAALSVDPELDRAAFDRLAAGIRRDRPVPILGLGYVRRVAAEEVGAFVDAARTDGAPDFPFPEASAGRDLGIVLYNEPRELVGGSWGADLLGVPLAAEGLQRATDSGGPVLSERLVLVIDAALPPDEQPASYVAYAPVYEPGAPVETVEQRRSAIIGWSNLPFRAQALADAVRLPEGVTFALHDVGGGRLAGVGEVGPGARRLELQVEGRRFELETELGAAFDRAGAQDGLLVGVIGTLISAVLAGMVALLASGSRRWARSAERATESLARSEEQLRATIRGAPDLILVLDGKGSIVSASDRAMEVLGRSPDELVGSPLEVALGLPLPGGAIPRLAVVGDGAGPPEVLDLEVGRADGTRIPVDLSSSPLRGGGAEGGDGSRVVIVRDVSARHEAQRQLAERALELERSNRDLEEFASVVSHDLSEPLRVVGGYVDLLAHRYPPGRPLDAAAVSYVAAAAGGVERMRTLIDDLLAYSRLRAVPVDPTDVDLGSVVAEVRANLELAIDEASAHVVVGDLPTVRGDRTLLTQLLQNLLANALRFRDESRALRIEVSASIDGSWCELEVRDNGCGIAPEDQARIFSMFRRGEAGADVPGTGIGLAVCRRIADLHGGALRLESQRGEGSTFLVRLQLAQPGATLGSLP